MRAESFEGLPYPGRGAAKCENHRLRHCVAAFKTSIIGHPTRKARE
jgi:hypothetical protein